MQLLLHLICLTNWEQTCIGNTKWNLRPNSQHTSAKPKMNLNLWTRVYCSLLKQIHVFEKSSVPLDVQPMAIWYYRSTECYYFVQWATWMLRCEMSLSLLRLRASRATTSCGRPPSSNLVRRSISAARESSYVWTLDSHIITAYMYLTNLLNIAHITVLCVIPQLLHSDELQQDSNQCLSNTSQTRYPLSHQCHIQRRRVSRKSLLYSSLTKAAKSLV